MSLLEMEPEESIPGRSLEMDPVVDDLTDALPTVTRAASEPVSHDDPGPATRALVALPLQDILGAGVALPTLVRFVPDERLRENLALAIEKAGAVAVANTGAEGLLLADAALIDLRNCLTAIETNFDEPKKIAHQLHKGLTSTLALWCMPGTAAIASLTRAVTTEQARIRKIEDDARRAAQADADRRAREEAKRRADAAAAQQAPRQVVQEMRQAAKTVSAPPVPTQTTLPAMRGHTPVTTWKARLAGCATEAESNPAIGAMSPIELAQVRRLLEAILAGTGPFAAIDINWSYLNKRAAAEKSTLAIAGIEAYEVPGLRARGARS